MELLQGGHRQSEDDNNVQGATVKMIYYNNKKQDGHVESVPIRFDNLHGPVM